MEYFDINKDLTQDFKLYYYLDGDIHFLDETIKKLEIINMDGEIVDYRLVNSFSFTTKSGDNFDSCSIKISDKPISCLKSVFISHNFKSRNYKLRVTYTKDKYEDCVLMPCVKYTNQGNIDIKNICRIKIFIEKLKKCYINGDPVFDLVKQGLYGYNLPLNGFYKNDKGLEFRFEDSYGDEIKRFEIFIWYCKSICKK